MQKSNLKFVITIVLVILLGAVLFTTATNMAKKTERQLTKDPEILQNYRDFQDMADKKGIAKMPNDLAKKVPEIKKILDERNNLLAKKAPGCTLEYRASIGERSAHTEPTKGHCDPMYFWKWFFI